MNKSIKKNAIMSILLTSANLLFPLIIYSFVARALTPVYIGKVTFSNSIITFFSYIAILGIPTYGLRQCSIVKDDKEKLSKTVIELLTISLIATGISYLLLFLATIFIPIFNQYQNLISVMSIYILLNSIGVEWFYKAMEEYTYITVRSIIFKFISLVLILLLIKSPNDYILYGFLSIFALSANYLCNIIHLHSYIQFKKYKLNIKQHLKPILILFSASIVITIYNNFDVFMIRLLNNEYQVGLYNTALKIRNALMSISIAISTVMIPRITYYLNNNKKEEAKSLLLKSTKISFMLTIPICIFIMAYTKDIVLLFCGKDYIESVAIIRTLLFCVMICCFTNIFGNQILIPLKKENKFTFSVTIGLLINCLFNCILIPKYGSVGAALATVITELWNAIYMTSQTKEYRNYIFKNINYGLYFLGYLIASIFAVIIYNVINCPLIFKIGIVGITYIVVFYLILYILNEKLFREILKSGIAKIKIKFNL